MVQHGLGLLALVLNTYIYIIVLADCIEHKQDVLAHYVLSGEWDVERTQLCVETFFFYNFSLPLMTMNLFLVRKVNLNSNAEEQQLHLVMKSHIGGERQNKPRF